MWVGFWGGTKAPESWDDESPVAAASSATLHDALPGEAGDQGLIHLRSDTATTHADVTFIIGQEDGDPVNFAIPQPLC